MKTTENKAIMRFTALKWKCVPLISVCVDTLSRESNDRWTDYYDHFFAIILHWIAYELGVVSYGNAFEKKLLSALCKMRTPTNRCSTSIQSHTVFLISIVIFNLDRYILWPASKTWKSVKLQININRPICVWYFNRLNCIAKNY